MCCQQELWNSRLAEEVGGAGGHRSAEAVYYSKQKSWDSSMLCIFVYLESVCQSKQKSWHFMQYAKVCLSKLGLNCQFLTEFLFFFSILSTPKNMATRVFCICLCRKNVGIQEDVGENFQRAFFCLVIHIILYHLSRACKFTAQHRTEPNVQLMTSDVNHEYSVEIDCPALV